MTTVSRETKEAIEQFGVSRETLSRLEIYAELLHRWAPRINLISRADLPHLWQRHILDSLQLLPHLPPVSQAIDIGSGAGFPGLILAIATGIRFDLIESDQRKCAFLREAARITGAPATPHPIRAESQNNLVKSPLITARALAPLSNLLSLATPLATKDAVFLFLKGAEADQELTAANALWNMSVQCFPSLLPGAGTILRISEVSPRV